MTALLAALIVVASFVPPAPGWTRPQLEAVVRDAAARHGANAAQLVATVDCETAGTWDPHARGDQGRSWGLLQFYCPSADCEGSLWREMHPDVAVLPSRDDPEAAADAAARAFAGGKQRRWTCWRILYEGGRHDDALLLRRRAADRATTPGVAVQKPSADYGVAKGQRGSAVGLQR